jgi:hypothetical protein
MQDILFENTTRRYKCIFSTKCRKAKYGTKERVSPTQKREKRIPGVVGEIPRRLLCTGHRW